MTPQKSSGSRKPGKPARKAKGIKTKVKRAAKPKPADTPHAPELVIITGMSGSGKASVLKAFEDLGYYCVDNLPVELIPRFAELALQSAEIRRTALVVAALALEARGATRAESTALHPFDSPPWRHRSNRRRPGTLTGDDPAAYPRRRRSSAG